MQLGQFRITRQEQGAFLGIGLLAIIWIIAYNNLQAVADWMTYTLLQLNRESQLGMSINFFIYDVPKILLLLSGMIFMITLLQTFINTHKVRNIVEKYDAGVGNIMASLFGAVTPFCSCSSVPLFIGFVQAGIPLGITFSFLITSPIMNEVAFVLLLGLFGWKIALLYLISGITIGVIAGLILGRMKLEKYVEEFVYANQEKRQASAFVENKLTWVERFQEAGQGTYEIVRKVWIFVIVGIGIGAFIHGFIPEDALTNMMGADAWWSVPVAVLLGIPLYANAAGIIPIVSALLGKGAALGTVLAFMMSVVALSLPEIIILRKVLKPRLIAIFIITVAMSIIFTGYLFNLMI